MVTIIFSSSWCLGGKEQTPKCALKVKCRLFGDACLKTQREIRKQCLTEGKNQDPMAKFSLKMHGLESSPSSSFSLNSLLCTRQPTSTCWVHSLSNTQKLPTVANASSKCWAERIWLALHQSGDHSWSNQLHPGLGPCNWNVSERERLAIVRERRPEETLQLVFSVVTHRVILVTVSQMTRARLTVYWFHPPPSWPRGGKGGGEGFPLVPWLPSSSFMKLLGSSWHEQSPA